MTHLIDDVKIAFADLPIKATIRSINSQCGVQVEVQSPVTKVFLHTWIGRRKDIDPKRAELLETITRHADGQMCSTSALPKYLRRKASRVWELVNNGHLMGTIAHDTGLSFGQINRIVQDRRLK
jgi:hypothetical protein